MGRPPKVTDDELETIVAERDSPIITTPQVARAADIDRRTANTRCEKIPNLESYSDGNTKAWKLKEGDRWIRSEPTPIQAAAVLGFWNVIRDHSIALIEGMPVEKVGSRIEFDKQVHGWERRFTPAIKILTLSLIGTFGAFVYSAINQNPFTLWEAVEVMAYIAGTYGVFYLFLRLLFNRIQDTRRETDA